MPRKVGIVNIEVRFCAECPYARPMTTPPESVGQDLRQTPFLQANNYDGADSKGDTIFNFAVTWWMCGRLGEQIVVLSQRLGDCPLVEVNQFQDELKIDQGDPKNHSPHQVSKGPTDAAP